MKLTAAHADTCLPSFWSGHHLAHIQVIVHKGMTLAELKAELISELNNGPVMGSEAPEEDDQAWYEAARQAVSEIGVWDDRGDETPLFTDLEEVRENDDGCESVYAFFVFVEGE